MLPIILLMVPLALAHININIEVLPKEEKVAIKLLSNKSSRKTTVDDLYSSGLTKEYLESLIRNKCLCRTLWDVSFFDGGDNPFTTNIKVVNREILKTDLYLKKLAVRNLHNTSLFPMKTKGTLSGNVSESLKSTWSSHAHPAVLRDIIVAFEPDLMLNKYVNHIEKMKIVNSTYDDTLRVDEKAKAILLAKYVKMTFKIDYEVTITGNFPYTCIFLLLDNNYFEEIHYKSNYSETIELIFAHKIGVKVLDREWNMAAEKKAAATEGPLPKIYLRSSFT